MLLHVMEIRESDALYNVETEAAGLTSVNFTFRQKSV